MIDAFYQVIDPYFIQVEGMALTVLPMEDGVSWVQQQEEQFVDLYPEITASGIYWNGFGQIRELCDRRGSLANWNENWFARFDLAIFLFVPAKIRIKRLEQRELDRYGENILNDPERNQQYRQFMDWCAGYTDNSSSGRTWAVSIAGRISQVMKRLCCKISRPATVYQPNPVLRHYLAERQ